MEYRIWFSPITFYQVSIAGQNDSGLSYQTTYFGAREQLQFALALGMKTGRRSLQVLVDVSRMTHELMNALVEVVDNLGESWEIEKAGLRDPVKTFRRDENLL